ncbi:MAG: hypothetical protein J6B77_03875, partial [Clostridia bacterium]|nr:hypothetical protein [Clostridia bacterium]
HRQYVPLIYNLRLIFKCVFFYNLSPTSFPFRQWKMPRVPPYYFQSLSSIKKEEAALTARKYSPEHATKLSFRNFTEIQLDLRYSIGSVR